MYFVEIVIVSFKSVSYIMKLTELEVLADCFGF